MVKQSMEVEEKTISVVKFNEQDYICLTDMVRGEEGTDHIKNWMRNRNTVEFIGLWETLNNSNFKSVEFDTFKKQAGLNSFTLTPKKWIDATNAIGIVSKSGKNGGTYAHKDIAFEFASWLSPTFKLYLITEYQRLKEVETSQYNLEWNVKRILSKANNYIHTDAVKNYILPNKNYYKAREWLTYAEEADLLNVALFNCTAKDWKEANPELAKKSMNIRDIASINELTILSNLEALNAEMIKEKVEKEVRFLKLRDIAKYQLSVLDGKDLIKALKKLDDSIYIKEK